MSDSTITTRPLTLLVTATLAAAILAGCAAAPPAADPSDEPTPSATATETPEPEPTRMPLVDLVLTTEGFDGLAIGSAPSTDPATAMATYDPAGCDGYGLWTTDPAYAADTLFGPPIAFGVGGDGTVQRIELYSDQIATDAGIRIGSTRADVDAAYPDAGVSPAALTDLYIVGGTAGALIIEVAADYSPGYWESSGIGLDTVQYIRAVPSGIEAYTIAASGNVVGVCGN